MPRDDRVRSQTRTAEVGDTPVVVTECGVVDRAISNLGLLVRDGIIGFGPARPDEARGTW